VAKTSQIVRASRPQKFKVRVSNRCQVCGRPRAYPASFPDVPYLLPRTLPSWRDPGCGARLVGNKRRHFFSRERSMGMTDPIADLLTRIRNASAVRHEKVAVPGFQPEAANRESPPRGGIHPQLQDHEGKPAGPDRHLLKYTPENSPVITGIERISKPGRRTYVKETGLPSVRKRAGDRDSLDLAWCHDRPPGACAEGGRRAHLLGVVSRRHRKEGRHVPNWEDYRSRCQPALTSKWPDFRSQVKGPKGRLSRCSPNGVRVVLSAGQAVVERENDERTARSMHGLARTLVRNMVDGCGPGFSRTLEIVGVGYKAEQKKRLHRLLARLQPPDLLRSPRAWRPSVETARSLTLSASTANARSRCCEDSFASES
jgi:small subunit ribosomal protein S8